MISGPKSLIKNENIEEIIAHRNKSLELLQQGLETLIAAGAEYYQATGDRKGLGLFSCGLRQTDWYTLDNDSHHSDRRLTELKEKFRKWIDQNTWERIINSSGIKNLMDAELESQLRRQLRDSPPEIELTTILATVEDLHSGREATFKKSVVNIFSRLCSGFKSNNPFKVGRRLIMPGAIGWNKTLNYSAKDELSDLDRILHIVQAIHYPGKVNDAAAIIQKAATDGKDSVETDFLKIKLFYGCGNLHIMIKSEILIDQINKILAEHFGATLPTEKRHHFKQPWM